MMRKSSLDGIESAPRWIVMFLGAYLVVHLFALYFWNMAGSAFSIEGTSGGTSGLSVTAMAAVGLWLCLLVLRSFPPGAPLRPAWMLITLAAAIEAISGALAQLLGSNWLLNPLMWGGQERAGLIEQIRHGAAIAGGPVQLALLAAGIGLLLLKNWARLGSIAYAIYKMIFVVANLIVLYTALGAMLQKALQNAPAVVVGIAAVSSAVGVVISLAYPGLLIFFMTRPKIVSAFQPPTPAARSGP